MRKIIVTAVIIGLIAACAVLAQFAGTGDEFSRYNTNWNGTSDFFGMAADDRCIFTYEALSGKTNTTLLIIAPDESFGADARLEAYLRAGNTVIIFDQNETANTFLSAIGSSIQVHNEPLRSVNMEYKDTGLFRADVEVPIPGTNVSNLFFNYPGYVTGGAAMVNTSYLAWIDVNGDNTPNKNESLNIYSLAASESIGSGRVVVAADPSVFINSMLDRRHTENMQVLSALMATPVLIDQTATLTTHGGGITGALTFIHRYPMAGVTLLAAIFLIAGGIYIRRRSKL